MTSTHPSKTVATKTKKHETDSDKSQSGPMGAYVYAVGRRKSATATVKVFNVPGGITVNGKGSHEYFQKSLEELLAAPLRVLGLEATSRVEARVSGGGSRGQAEAIRLGISRALLKRDSQWKKALRSNGLVTRDPRAKERKKYGLKKARRAPQWTKR